MPRRPLNARIRLSGSSCALPRYEQRRGQASGHLARPLRIIHTAQPFTLVPLPTRRAPRCPVLILLRSPPFIGSVVLLHRRPCGINSPCRPPQHRTPIAPLRYIYALRRRRLRLLLGRRCSTTMQGHSSKRSQMLPAAAVYVHQLVFGQTPNHTRRRWPRVCVTNAARHGFCFILFGCCGVCRVSFSGESRGSWGLASFCSIGS